MASASLGATNALVARAGASASAGAYAGVSFGATASAAASTSVGVGASYSASASAQIQVSATGGASTGYAVTSSTYHASGATSWNVEAGLRQRYTGLRFEPPARARPLDPEQLRALFLDAPSTGAPVAFLASGRAVPLERGLRAEVSGSLELRFGARERRR